MAQPGDAVAVMESFDLLPLCSQPRKRNKGENIIIINFSAEDFRKAAAGLV